MARPRKKKEEASERLSKEDWVRQAAETLARGGVGAVRVEVLAADLNVTKGSFYWHFKDREALLVEVLQAWRAAATVGPLTTVRQRAKDPREQIRVLLDMATASESIATPGGPFEQAIREWGLTSRAAKEALRQVDLDRLSILTDMYLATGMKKAQASAYATLLYSYAIGSNHIASDIGRQAMQAIRQSIASILTP